MIRTVFLLDPPAGYVEETFDASDITIVDIANADNIASQWEDDALEVYDGGRMAR